MSPVGYANDVTSALNEVRVKSLMGKPPKHLYHYTKLSGVKGIIESRCLWATCVAEMADPKEICLGAEIVEREALSLARNEPSFVREVLNGLPDHIRKRMAYTFIACFCGLGGSTYHWQTYGDYRLTIPTDDEHGPLVSPASLGVNAQYHKVLYDRCKQEAALRALLRTLKDALKTHVAGAPSGASAEWLVGFLTRVAAEILLDLIVALKGREFRPDREWRIVVRPNRSPLTSAPTWEDQQFLASSVKNGVRKYIPLYLQSNATALLFSSSRPAVPFEQVEQSPSLGSSAELKQIRNLLVRHNRPDIPVQGYKGNFLERLSERLEY